MKRYISDIILYSCLGIFSFFVLVTLTDLPIKYQEKLMTPKAFLAVALFFSGIGLSVKYVNEKLNLYYHWILKDKKSFFIAAGVSVTILLILNYFTLAISKYIVGMSEPFLFKPRGVSVILGVWLIEIIFVGQFMQNRFYSDLVRLYVAFPVSRTVLN